MRYKNKIPREGDTRIITRYLYFPLRVFDETTDIEEVRWFERAAWLEKYEYDWDGPCWYRIKFIDDTSPLTPVEIAKWRMEHELKKPWWKFW